MMLGILEMESLAWSFLHLGRSQHQEKHSLLLVMVRRLLQVSWTVRHLPLEVLISTVVRRPVVKYLSEETSESMVGSDAINLVRNRLNVSTRSVLLYALFEHARPPLRTLDVSVPLHSCI